MLAWVRRLNRIETVGEGLRAALEETARVSPGWIVPLLREGWDERYGRKVETARLLGRKHASAQALAAQTGADGQGLLAAVDADPDAAWVHELPQVKILRILWDRHDTPTSTGRLRFKAAAELPPAAQRLHPPCDPDARHSTRGKGGDDDLGWVGSKAHRSESCDADTPNLVTGVHTTPATEPDVAATTAAQDKLIAPGAWPRAGTCWMRAAPAPTTSPPAPNAAAPWSPRSSSRPAATPATAPSARAGSPSTGRPAPPAAPPARPAAPCAPTSAAWPPSRSPAATAGPARSATSAPWPVPTSPAGSPSTPNRSTRPPWRPTGPRTATSGAPPTTSVPVSRAPSPGRARPGPAPRPRPRPGQTHLQNGFTGMALNSTRLGAHFLKPEPGPARRPTRIHELCTAHGLAAA